MKTPFTSVVHGPLRGSWTSGKFPSTSRWRRRGSPVIEAKAQSPFDDGPVYHRDLGRYMSSSLVLPRPRVVSIHKHEGHIRSHRLTPILPTSFHFPCSFLSINSLLNLRCFSNLDRRQGQKITLGGQSEVCHHRLSQRDHGARRSLDSSSSSALSIATCCKRAVRLSGDGPSGSGSSIRAGTSMGHSSFSPKASHSVSRPEMPGKGSSTDPP